MRNALHGHVTHDLIGRPEPPVYDPMGRHAATDWPAGDRAPTNIYRARRPAVAVLLTILATLVGLLMVRGLAISAFRDPFVLGGVIASSLMLVALPLLAVGLYGLITGASHGAEQWGFRVWARLPLAYLLVGLAFAAIAASAIT